MILRAGIARHSNLGGFAARGIIVAMFVPQGRTALYNSPEISIVDDDGFVRIATYNLVKSLGYTVHTFASAEEFLQSPHLNATSCVIADVQMPAMSGIELQAHLLANGRCVPFIFVTAFPIESTRARAPKAPATCFLAKPFDGDALVKCIEAALVAHDWGAGK